MNTVRDYRSINMAKILVSFSIFYLATRFHLVKSFQSENKMSRFYVLENLASMLSKLEQAQRNRGDVLAINLDKLERRLEQLNLVEYRQKNDELSENVTRLAVEVSELQQDVLRVRGILDTALVSLSEQTAQFEAEILAQLNNRDDSIVAFSANGPQPLSFDVDDVITFTTPSLNKGVGYNSADGFFEAPVYGLYQFIVQACNSNDNSIPLAIVHQGEEIARGTQYRKYDSSCTTMRALLVMDQTDRVWIKSTYQGEFGEDNLRRATFMGYLVN